MYSQNRTFESLSFFRYSIFKKNGQEVIEVSNKETNCEVPVWEKSNLTIDEAAQYFGIGKSKIRELSDRPDCSFVLWVGSKRLIKRKKFDEFIENSYSI